MLPLGLPYRTRKCLPHPPTRRPRLSVRVNHEAFLAWSTNERHPLVRRVLLLWLSYSYVYEYANFFYVSGFTLLSCRALNFKILVDSSRSIVSGVIG